MGTCLRYRPHVDIRFASINQKLNLDSEGQILEYELEQINSIGSGRPDREADFIMHEKITHDFHGTGLRAGLDVEWDLGLLLQAFTEILLQRFSMERVI